jgi:hypothetical protein
MYCNDEHRTYGKVYHNKELKEAVFSDGRFMIISKELFNKSKDVEYLKKNAYKDFDYHTFDYRKVLYPKDDLVEADCRLFRSEVYLANETLFDKELSYKNALNNKVYFKDFDFVLSVPIIHVVNEFFNDNKNLETKLYVNKEDITKNIMIEVYSGDILNDDVLNMMLFMPIASNNDYQVTIENNELEYKSGTYQKNIEKLYSWSDMANALTDKGVPHEVVRNLADMQMSMIMNRPIFNVFKFDDWLHEKFGDYESEKKSMRDMFNQLFGDDSDKIAYYFGIEVKEK